MYTIAVKKGMNSSESLRQERANNRPLSDCWTMSLRYRWTIGLSPCENGPELVVYRPEIRSETDVGKKKYILKGKKFKGI